MPPLAHMGHWAVGLIYLAPVLIVVATLAVMSRRERAAEARSQDDRQEPQ